MLAYLLYTMVDHLLNVFVKSMGNITSMWLSLTTTLFNDCHSVILW